MNSGYQGYSGGGGGYYGGGSSQGQSYNNTQSQFSQQPPPQQQQQWQYSQQPQQTQGNGYGQSAQQQQQPPQQQQQHQAGGYGQSQQGGYGQPQQQQQPSMFGFGQPQQQQQQPNLWNPAMAAATMGMMSSLAAGQGVVPTGMFKPDEFTDQAGARFNSLMLMLRSYFAVDNRYVVQKLKRIVFPFLTKHWRRNVKGAGPDPTRVSYDLPIADDNAPDLYIPSMSLITYVLLCAFCYGNAGQFNPEVIPDVCTKCFFAQLLEVIAIRVGFYMMQTDVPFLDLWSYTGYKYTGLCINMMVGILGRVFELGGTTTYYASFLWTASAAAFLMLKIMSHTVPLQTSASGPKREVMVLAFAVCQPVIMWFVSQTKFL